MTKLLGTKDFAQFVIQTKLKMKFTFSSTSRNVQLLEMIFFHQKQSYFTNFKLIPYSDLGIKLMNSKDSHVNLRLMNFVSLLINLPDSLLSLQNDHT